MEGKSALISKRSVIIYHPLVNNKKIVVIETIPLDFLSSVDIDIG